MTFHVLISIVQKFNFTKWKCYPSITIVGGDKMKSNKRMDRIDNLAHGGAVKPGMEPLRVL